MAKRTGASAHGQLKTVFRGISRPEVDAVIAEACGALDAVRDDIDAMRARLARVNATLIAAHADERETTRTLSRAETLAGTIRQDASRRADDVMRHAEARAADLVRDAELQRDALRDYIAQCIERQSRLHGTLQREMEELRSYLAAGPALLRTATHHSSNDLQAVEAPAFVPAAASTASSAAVMTSRPVSAPPIFEAPEIASMLDALEDAMAAPASVGVVDAWSSEDVESALKAATVDTFAEHSGSSERDAASVRDDRPGVDEPSTGAAWFNEAGEAPSGRRLRRFAPAAAAVAIAVIGGMLAYPRTTPPAPAVQHRRVGATAMPRAVPPEPAPVPAAARPQPVDAAASSPSAPRTLVVRVQATRPCWIAITIDGRKENRLLAQGEEIVRESSSDVLLRVGDASALTVFVNDQRLPPLGPEGEVVTRRLTAPPTP